MNIKKIPYGDSDYGKIIEQNKLYVECRQNPIYSRTGISIDLDLKALNTFSCDYPVEKVHGCANQFLSKYDFSWFKNENEQFGTHMFDV